MMNLTMGNPYATTHVTRPFDMGKYEPEEHPFTGIGRMIAGIGEVKKAVPEMVIFGSAPTYLRQFADLYTAGAVEEGFCDGMLFGRMAFADPDYANEIIKNGRIDPKRVCMTCGKCGDLIRAHKPTGCVIRDPKTFMPFYKEFLEIKKKQPAFQAQLQEAVEREKKDPHQRVMHIWELAKYRLNKKIPNTLTFEERKVCLINSKEWNGWINQHNKHLSADELTEDNIQSDWKPFKLLERFHYFHSPANANRIYLFLNIFFCSHSLLIPSTKSSLISRCERITEFSSLSLISLI